MTTGGYETRQSRRQAPAFDVPKAEAQVVEHPCIIKNVDRGIKSLGGNRQLDQFLQVPAGTADNVIGVSLRPEDPQASTIESRAVLTKNVALLIRAPKWTGRRRKRGSNDPFEYHGRVANGDARDGQASNNFNPGPGLWRILRDNPDGFTVSAVGQVTQNHRFRGLPDFQHSMSTDPIGRRLRDTIMTNELPRIKQFATGTLQDLPADWDHAPPPFFHSWKVPAVYEYKQSPYARLIVDPVTGQEKLVNINPKAVRVQINIPHDSPTVPSGPPDYLQPEERLEPGALECVRLLRKELEKRPVMVKRVQQNLIKHRSEYNLRQAWPYVGYMFRIGPFRDAIIKYGVDPRADVKYRKYQTLIFHLPPGPGGVGDLKRSDSQLSSRAGSAASSRPASPTTLEGPSTSFGIFNDRKGQRIGKRELARHQSGEKYQRRHTVRRSQRLEDSHLFDGKRLCRDGKTWQLIDITDPVIRSLIDTTELRSECDTEFCGWYGNGTWAAIRLIMKEMINDLAEGKPPGCRNELYETFIEGLPHFINDGDSAAYYYSQTKNSELLQLSTKLRVVARGGNVKSLAKERAQARGLLGHGKRTGATPTPKRAGNIAIEDSDIDENRDDEDTDDLEDEDDMEAGEMDELSNEEEDEEEDEDEDEDEGEDEDD